MTLQERQLLWAGCANVRHLGGFSARGGQTHALGLIRADNLSRLTHEGQAAVRACGVSAVLDLRSAYELELERNPFQNTIEGPLYLHRPLMDEADREGMQQIEARPDLGGMYVVMLERFPHTIAAIFQALADAPEGAVVVHCHAGKDRTGLVTALALALVGVDETHIVEDYVLSDLYLASLYAEIMEKLTPDSREAWRQREVSRPEAIETALRHLRERHGGADAYLRAAGLSEATLERVERRLVAPLQSSGSAG